MSFQGKTLAIKFFIQAACGQRDYQLMNFNCVPTTRTHTRSRARTFPLACRTSQQLCSYSIQYGLLTVWLKSVHSRIILRYML